MIIVTTKKRRKHAIKASQYSTAAFVVLESPKAIVRYIAGKKYMAEMENSGDSGALGECDTAYAFIACNHTAAPIAAAPAHSTNAINVCLFMVSFGIV